MIFCGLKLEPEMDVSGLPDGRELKPQLGVKVAEPRFDVQRSRADLQVAVFVKLIGRKEVFGHSKLREIFFH